MSRLSNNDIVAIGATVGGHGLLLAVIALGLLGMEEKIEKPESLSVELVGEGSPEPVTGDVGAASAASEIVEESPEESSEPAEEVNEVEDTRAAEAAAERANEAAEAKADAARAAANAKAAADAAKRADATAAQKKQAKEAAEKAARLKREQEAADRKAKAAREKAAKEKAAKDKAAKDKAAKDKAAKEKAAKDKAAREKAAREFEGIGDKLGGNASATADQARSKASATIGAEVRPAVAANCKLSAGEPSSLQVFVTMTINKNRTLASASVYDVRGTTPQNSSQVEPAKQCVLKSLRSVSPYNLNEADYDVWKNHKVQIKVNLK